MSTGLVVVGTGAALGAWLRWSLGLLLNPVFPTLPLDTLCANLLVGYLMGLTMGFLARVQSLPPEVRLFAPTGFLGQSTRGQRTSHPAEASAWIDSLRSERRTGV